VSIDIRNASYVPTIYLRSSELLAVEELPDSTKDILTPIFCLKPWASSKLLSASMTKIESVYPNRPFFLDIDPFYDKDATRPAQHDFYDLTENDDENQSWVNFFDEFPNAFPCLQVNHAELAAIQNQIDEFTDRERLFLVRLDRENGSGWSSIVDLVCATTHANFGFVIDAGWSRDLLSRASWVDGLVKQIVQLRGDDIPIVVTGSSFPNSFTSYSKGERVELKERTLFNQLVVANNQAQLVYGDWASSRSPSEGGGGAAIPPRIDLPTGTTWEIYRSEDDTEGFKELADEVRESSEYPQDLDIWATYMLEATSLDDPNGIKSLQKATAVRINMHLYRQIHFDNFNPAPDTDDEYQE
jgi:hypothetical protein